MIWLLLLLPVCCGAIVIFGLLIPRKPVLAGLGIALAVACITGAALFLFAPAVRSAKFAAYRARHPHPPTPQLPTVKPESEVRDAEGGPARRRRRVVRLAVPEGPVLAVSEVPGTSSVLIEMRGDKTSLTGRMPYTTRDTSVRRRAAGTLVRTVLTALAIAVFLYVGYIFLDASTRGHFTWSLRLLSVLAFVVIYAAMSVLRHY